MTRHPRPVDPPRRSWLLSTRKEINAFVAERGPTSAPCSRPGGTRTNNSRSIRRRRHERGRPRLLRRARGRHPRSGRQVDRCPLLRPRSRPRPQPELRHQPGARRLQVPGVRREGLRLVRRQPAWPLPQRRRRAVRAPRARSPRPGREGGGGLEGVKQPRNSATPLGCTVEQYAAAKRLPADFLRTLGVSDYTDGRWPDVKVLRIPYRASDGKEDAVRIRYALEGADRFLWRKGSKPSLYGLWRLEELRGCAVAGGGGIPSTPGVVLVEGESDSHVLWHHGIPALGLPRRRELARGPRRRPHGRVQPDLRGDRARQGRRRSARLAGRLRHPRPRLSDRTRRLQGPRRTPPHRPRSVRRAVARRG